MSAQPEVWRVSTFEGVFETDLETLKQWIVEGCVLPTDKVSKGSLNWIEAGRAPMLKAAFSAERVAPATPQSPAMVHPPTDAFPRPVDVDPESARSKTQKIEPAQASESSTSCHNHAGVYPDYICRMCSEVFCNECARVVKGVTLCPLCGDLCKPFEQVKARAASVQFRSSGFGIKDFVRAL